MKIEKIDYNDRYTYLKKYILNENFSNLTGMSWYKKCSEYFDTIRLHIAKIRLFREISEDFVKEHWIREIVNNLSKMIDEKLSKWTIDKYLFMTISNDWLESFSNSSVMYKIVSTEYEPYRKSFMLLHNLTKNKEIKQFLNNDSKLCDEVFLNVLTILSNALSDKKLNTKKSSSVSIMKIIRKDIILELEKLVKN